MKKICLNCKYYTPYYKMYTDSIMQADIGHCDLHKKISKRFILCDDFKDNKVKEIKRYGMTMASLQRALQSINDISLILKEKEKEKEEENMM